MIFIPKPGKDSYRHPSSFLLSNYLLKTLERLVVWRVERELVHFPIHNHQHGFLSHKSTESALSQTVNVIEKAFHEKTDVIGVFLDISSAFNSMQPHQITSSLMQHGTPDDIARWYENYITDRRINVTLHGHTKQFKSSIGFPQGGVASAKFWLIAFDRAIHIINSHGIVGHGFADDLCALATGKDLKEARTRMQAMLNELVDWGKTCGLFFNHAKTVAIHFTRKRKPLEL
jgi:hypothetical protein